MEKNLKNPAVMGKKIFSLIEKHKILLLQDKSFPNIVSKIVGEDIVGSWWGHPLANPIYNGLQWLEENHSVLVLKLISGKVTYIHESLFLDMYSVVQAPRGWQTKKLKDDELKLLKYISKKKKITSNDPKLAELAKDPKKGLTKLETNLLVFSSEEHTDSGKHIKEFKVWQDSPIFNAKPGDYETSLKKIEGLVLKLGAAADTKVKLPWL